MVRRGEHMKGKTCPRCGETEDIILYHPARRGIQPPEYKCMSCGLVWGKT